jgi:CheY-like chemotaxis protein
MVQQVGEVRLHIRNKWEGRHRRKGCPSYFRSFPILNVRGAESVHERLRILCVDDNAVGLMIRASLLEKFGYEVIPSTTGKQAMGILASENIDIAIVNHYLGSSTGIELVTRMKKKRPGLRTVLFSGTLEILEGLESLARFMLQGEGPQRLDALIRLLTNEEMKVQRNYHLEAVPGLLAELLSSSTAVGRTHGQSSWPL